MRRTRSTHRRAASRAPASFTPNGGGFSGSFSACRISMIINGGIAHPFRPAPLNSFENHDSVIVARHGIDTARQSSPHGRGVGFVPSRIVMRPVVNKPLLACKLHRGIGVETQVREDLAFGADVRFRR